MCSVGRRGGRFSVAADVRCQRESRYSPAGRYRDIILSVFGLLWVAWRGGAVSKGAKRDVFFFFRGCKFGPHILRFCMRARVALFRALVCAFVCACLYTLACKRVAVGWVCMRLCLLLLAIVRLYEVCDLHA